MFEKGVNIFKEVIENKDNLSFFTSLKEKEDELLDWVDDINYAVAFFDNQIDIFDKGLNIFKKCQENKDYLNEALIQDITCLEDILHDPIPYTRIRNIIDIVQNIEKRFNIIVEEKRQKSKAKIKEDFDYCLLKSNQYGVNSNTTELIRTFYDSLIIKIGEYTDIFKIDASITQSNNKREYFDQSINKEIAEYLRKKKAEEAIGITIADPPIVQPELIPKKVEKVNVARLVEIKSLKTVDDIEVYIRELKNKLKSIINDNKEIEIE